MAGQEKQGKSTGLGSLESNVSGALCAKSQLRKNGTILTPYDRSSIVYKRYGDIGKIEK